MNRAVAVSYPLLSMFAYRVLLVAFGLFVVVAWMPRLMTIGDSDIGVGALLLAIMAAAMLFAPKLAQLDPQVEVYRFAIFCGVGFLLFWGYLGVFRLDEPLRAGRLFLSVGQGVILLYVMSQVLSVRALRLSLALAVVMLVGTCLLSLYNYLGGPPTSLTILIAGYDRSWGLFKNPNQFGMILAMCVPFAVALSFRPGFRLWAVLLLVTVFIGLMLAASKTNLVICALLLLATMSYMLFLRGRTRTLLFALPLVTVVTVFAGLPLLELLNPRAATILADLLTDGGIGENRTVEQRFDMWSLSLDALRDSPLFGQGTGQPLDTTANVFFHSHNVIIDLARTTGIPGVIGALVFLGASCWLAVHTLLRIARLPSQLVAELPGLPIVVGASFAVFSYMMSNQMSDSFGPSTSGFFWLCLGLIMRRDELLFANVAGSDSRTTDSAPHPVPHRHETGDEAT